VKINFSGSCFLAACMSQEITDISVINHTSSPTAAFYSASAFLVSLMFCVSVFSFDAVNLLEACTNLFFAAEIFWIFCLWSLSSILSPRRLCACVEVYTDYLYLVEVSYLCSGRRSYKVLVIWSASSELIVCP
jgi:hypothetical protein